jgi:hypothetical protein
MNYQATRLMEEHEKKARARANEEQVRSLARKARGELEPAAALGMALLEASGMGLEKAAERMLAPDMGLMLETSAERSAAALYKAMDFESARLFNEDLSPLEALPLDSVGHFALWSFEDGSAWISFRLHEREMGWEALMASTFKEREKVGNALWALWDKDHAPLGLQVGAKLLEAKRLGSQLCALTPAEARAFFEGLPRAWGEGSSWGQGLAMKAQNNGTTMTPVDFGKQGCKALSKGKEEACKAGMRKMEELRKERDARSKVHWRDAMCVFMSQGQAMPVYDAGMAAFLMSKPGLFGQYPLPVWRKMFFEIVDIVKRSGEGESPELSDIEAAASILGGDTASQLAHFLYRYHRAGGAKMMAKRVLDQARERIEADSAKQGLAAAVKGREAPVSDEMREASKASSSVEFSTQYGAALALMAAQWGKESGFADIGQQARAVIKTMRGAGEISMECFGWFARLMFEFSEGFVSKEEIAKALAREMEASAKTADEEKRRGGKITIENEWSGNWGAELAGRKVREYLDLERMRSGQEPKG